MTHGYEWFTDYDFYDLDGGGYGDYDDFWNDADYFENELDDYEDILGGDFDYGI